MGRDFFKTTARQRESAQEGRENRQRIGMPESKEVDEALSMALRKTLKRLKSGGEREMTTSAFLDDICKLAIEHLAAKRGMNREMSWNAIQLRLLKPRRYLASSPKKR